MELLLISREGFCSDHGPFWLCKSTLLNLIGGLDWPTSGSIFVDGEEIEALDETELAAYRRNK